MACCDWGGGEQAGAAEVVRGGAVACVRGEESVARDSEERKRKRRGKGRNAQHLIQAPLILTPHASQMTVRCTTSPSPSSSSCSFVGGRQRTGKRPCEMLGSERRRGCVRRRKVCVGSWMRVERGSQVGHCAHIRQSSAQSSSSSAREKMRTHKVVTRHSRTIPTQPPHSPLLSSLPSASTRSNDHLTAIAAPNAV